MVNRYHRRMHISTMLVFWSLVSLIRNSVVLAVYLLFLAACFFTVHEHYHPANIVIDPVMYAKNGCPLMEPAAIKALIETVIPLADVLTPNILEAEKITGGRIKSVADMEKAAKAIHTMGCRAVVVKGGHAEGNAVDVLFDGIEICHFDTARIDTKNTHGTGCTFSSAVASQLARGMNLWEAVQKAKDYVTMAIEHSLDIGKGCGPTHHFWHLYQYGLKEEGDGGK